MTKKEILDTLISYYDNGSTAAFARRINESQQNINNWRCRDVFNIYKIAKHCPEINPDWLLSDGEGEMLRTPTQIFGEVTSSQFTGANINGGNINTAPTPGPLTELITTTQQSTSEFITVVKKSQEQIDRLISIIEQQLNHPTPPPVSPNR